MNFYKKNGIRNQTQIGSVRYTDHTPKNIRSGPSSESGIFERWRGGGGARFITAIGESAAAGARGAVGCGPYAPPPTPLLDSTSR